MDVLFPLSKMTKILVIDDEDSLRESVIAILRSNGFDAADAKNGSEGLELADRALYTSTPPENLDFFSHSLEQGEIPNLRSTKSAAFLQFSRNFVT